MKHSSGPTIATPAPEFAADQLTRLMPQALDEGLPALVKDATGGQMTVGLLGSQVLGVSTSLDLGLLSQGGTWAWPGPGEMERTEVGGSLGRTIYQAKIEAARLENVWRDSAAASAAVPFVNQPAIEGWPPSVQGSSTATGFDAAVDDQGRDLHAYWAESFYHKMIDGVFYTLADLPAEIGGRAYWVAVRAANVLEVVTVLVNGKLRAVEARIRWRSQPAMAIRNDPASFPHRLTEEVIRIYRVSELLDSEESDGGGKPGGPVHFRESIEREVNGEMVWVWVQPRWVPLRAAAGVFTEIPLTPHYSNRVAPFRGRPPFLDTASQQMAHWRKMLDLDERIRRDARNLVAISGASKSEAAWDGRAVWLPNADAKATLLETTGMAHKGIRDDLEQIRVSIQSGNLRPLRAQAQVTRTATEINTARLAADSLLEMWILLDIASFSNALDHVAKLNGEDGPRGEVILPHDFGLDDKAMDSLLAGYIQSKGDLVPAEVVWPEMRRHQRISEHINPKKIIDLVNARTRGTDNE